MEIGLLYTPIGLILDIVGAILIFVHSPEISSFVTTHSPDMWEKREEIQRQDRKRRRTARTGILLLAAGFAFQFSGYLTSLLHL